MLKWPSGEADAPEYAPAIIPAGVGGAVHSGAGSCQPEEKPDFPESS